MTNKAFLKEHRLLTVVCLSLFLAGIFRLNDLSLLNPDSTRYLIWGNSIARGEGFVDNTQPEPYWFVIHAPLYPILIAPIEFFFPLSVTAVKLWTLLWSIFSVIIFYFFLFRAQGKLAALGGILIFACNPLVLIYSTEILSDIPFLCCALLVLFLSDKDKTDGLSRIQLILLVLSVLAVGLLREIGVSMIISIVIYYYINRRKRLALFIFLISSALLVLWYVRNDQFAPIQGGNIKLITQHFVTPPGESLINELTLRMWNKLHEYLGQISGMLIYPLVLSQQFRLNVEPSQLHQALSIIMKSFGQFVVLVLTVPMALFGIFLDFKRSQTAILKLLFGFIYLGFVLLYPAHDIRFLLPLLPLLICYLMLSVQWLLVKIKFPDKFYSPKYLITGILFLMLPNLSGIYEIIKMNIAYQASPVKFYQKLRLLSAYPQMFTQPWSMMGEWISKNLPDTVVLASPSKELSAVVGVRKVLEIDQSSALPTFESLLRDNHVDYVLTTVGRGDFNVFEFHLKESKRFTFDSSCRIANLYLYRVRSRLRELLYIKAETCNSEDSLNTAYFLREGRKYLLAEKFELAAQKFAYALSIDSTMPEVYYQMIVAYSMMGDSNRVKLYYDKLFTLPQALGYVGNARTQVQAMRMFAKAQKETDHANKTSGALDVSSLYWKLGYYKRAASIMNSVLETDTSYFVGLLWGLHFNLQNGDTGIAKRYLRILRKMDETNPVVGAFTNILTISDSLLSTSNLHPKSRYHLEMGIWYKKIELNEEALDEAERALSYDPENAGAYLLIAQVFERKSNLRMAVKYYKAVIINNPEDDLVSGKVDSILNILSNK